MIHRGDDRGSVAVETAIIMPALVALLLLVGYAGRTSQAEADVRRAASEAARYASLIQDPASARATAQEVAGCEPRREWSGVRIRPDLRRRDRAGTGWHGHRDRPMYGVDV